MAVSAAVPRGRGAAQRGATPHEKCARSAPSQRAGRSRRFLEVLTVFFSKKILVFVSCIQSWEKWRLSSLLFPDHDVSVTNGVNNSIVHTVFFIF